MRPDEHRAVAVLTDSTTARFALSRGYSPSFLVNAIAHRCQSAFKNVRLDFYHVPGTMNAVDPFSRGMSPPPYGDTVAALRRMMGMVPALNSTTAGADLTLGGYGVPIRPL